MISNPTTRSFENIRRNASPSYGVPARTKLTHAKRSIEIDVLNALTVTLGHVYILHTEALFLFFGYNLIKIENVGRSWYVQLKIPGENLYSVMRNAYNFSIN